MSERSSRLRSRARLRLELPSVEEARLASAAVEPDNQPLPKGLEIEMKRVGKVVEIYVECDRTLASLLATLDDILAMMLLALRVSRRAD